MFRQENILKKASTLMDKKNYKEAKFILLEFFRDNKNIKVYAKSYYLLYKVFDSLGEIKKAKNYLEKFLKLENNNHIATNNLANIFFKEENLIKAEKFYLKTIEIKNDYLIGIVNIAIFYESIGKLDEARKFYLKAIALSPETISIYFNLSRIDKDFINKEKIKYISGLMKDKRIKLIDMAYGYFLLAENERKKNSFTTEFDYLKKGHHHLFKEKLDKNNLTLNYWQNIIPIKYNKFSYINENTKSELMSLNPIFIIGLPRSGSTIIEAILSSGEANVKNFGETNMFNGAVVSSHNELKNKESTRIDLDLINNIILQSINNKDFLNTKNKIFTDKSLENFFYIEIILKIFPKAKFVNTFRNIEDNIFAIFQQVLSKLSWTHSIENILKYVDNYLKIINYSIKKYPDKIFQLELEELTNKPEKTSKQLYSFCNLKWNEKVLDYRNRKDLLLSTASNIQVRGNIQKYNHEKYRPYKEFIKKFSNEYTWINKD